MSDVLTNWGAPPQPKNTFRKNTTLIRGTSQEDLNNNEFNTFNTQPDLLLENSPISSTKKANDL